MKKNSLIKGSFTFDGKRYWVYANSKKELIEKIALKKQALQEGVVLIESSMLVKDWADVCLDTYKQFKTDVSEKRTRGVMRLYICQHIGNMKLKDVRPLHCQKCLNELKGKSKYIIDQTYQLLNFMFNKAVDDNLINKNPAKNINKPEGFKNTRRALTNYEEEVFLKVIEKHQHALYFMLMYGCGCRPSEAVAVEGRDIIFQQGKPLLHIRGTKSKAADRYVPIPLEVMHFIPKNPEPFKKLCRTSHGNGISRECARRAWSTLERLMNIEMGCKVYRNELIPPYPLASDLCAYCLRHTYCTNLQKRGVDIRTAQRLMGHSDIRLTANIYTHISNEMLVEDYDIITNNSKAEYVVGCANG